MQTWDEYRISLFKKKIRDILPEVRGLRFERSKGKCNLIINVRWRYYKHADEVFALIMGRLKEHGIEGETQKMFTFSRGLDYITIPIDQAALPERKRMTPSRFQQSANGCEHHWVSNKDRTSADSPICSKCGRIYGSTDDNEGRRDG